MSMNGSFLAISGALYAQLRRDPALLEGLLATGDGAQLERLLPSLPPELQEQIRAQLRASRAELDKLPSVDPSEVGGRLDIDKAWHVVHFLVTASAGLEPRQVAANFVIGGEDCGDDRGYGPARLLGPDAVATIAAALPPAEVLRPRFDPAAMAAADLYPGGWTEQPADELWDWARGSYDRVREFYRAAAAAGHAVVLWIH